MIRILIVFLSVIIFMLAMPFGSSLLITLDNRSNLGDTHADEAAIDDNKGTLAEMNVIAETEGFRQRSYIMFNMTNVTRDCDSIDAAELVLFAATAATGGKVVVYEVHANSTCVWEELELTWRNQPANQTEDPTGGCTNNTPATNITVDTASVSVEFNVTPILKSALARSYDNVSFMIQQSPITVGLGITKNFDTRDKTPGTLPLLNITCTEAPPVDSCSYTSGNFDIDLSDNCVLTSLIDVGSDAVHVTGSGTLTIASGAELVCKEFHFTPDNLDGTNTFSIETGGTLSVRS